MAPPPPQVPSERKRELWINDNLAVMRGLPDDSIDFIYLDPPFNSKREYAAPIGTKAEGQRFDDTWTWDQLNTEWLGEISQRNEALSSVIHAARLTQGEGTAAYLTFMGIRLLEMQRLMKSDASVYLHCDDSANAYLRASMDAVFGKDDFRNEIVWKRTAGRSDGTQFGRVHDNILFYAPKGATWNRQHLPHDPEYIARQYRLNDGDGRGNYRVSELTGPKVSRGESGKSWRGIDPGRAGRCWSAPLRGDYADWIEQNVIPNYKSIKGVHDRLNALDSSGMIHWPKKKGGMPGVKRYLSSTKGRAVEDVFADIGKLEANAKEKTGWATQKPLALLQRLIKASSNKGDVVLDPFAGCATACVAAEIEGRQWIGIEACEAAGDIVKLRLDDATVSFDQTIVDIRTETPPRLDLPEPTDESTRKKYRTDANVNALYGLQRGNCNGCNCHAEARAFHMDHIQPQSQHGSDEIENLQLLCGPCNSTKGDDLMEDLWGRNVEKTIIPSDMVPKLEKRHQAQRKELALDLSRRMEYDFPIKIGQKGRKHDTARMKGHPLSR